MFCALATAAKKLNLITGKGLHSENQKARLLPAILEYLDDQNLRYEIKQRGGGVLVDIPDAYSAGNVETNTPKGAYNQWSADDAYK
jgi:hypothetical protein